MIGRWHCTDQTVDTQFSFHLEKSTHHSSPGKHTHANLSNTTPYTECNAAHAQVMSVERVHSFAKNGHCIFVTRKKKITHFTYTSVCVRVPFLILSNFRRFFLLSFLL